MAKQQDTTNVLSKFDKPTQVSVIDMAFGGGPMRELMPDYKDIPAEFASGKSKWCKFQSDWFYSGINPAGLIAKDGIDKAKALGHLKAINVSFEPKHEHKAAAVAYLASRWFTDASTWTALKSLALFIACAVLLSACGESPTTPTRIGSGPNLKAERPCVGVRQQFTADGLFVENCTDQIYIAGFGASAVPRINGKPDPDLTHQTLLAQTSYTLAPGESGSLSIAYDLPCDQDAQLDGWKLTHTVPNVVPRDPSSGKPRSGPNSLIPGTTEAGVETIGTIIANRGSACGQPPAVPPTVPPVPPTPPTPPVPPTLPTPPIPTPDPQPDPVPTDGCPGTTVRPFDSFTARSVTFDVVGSNVKVDFSIFAGGSLFSHIGALIFIHGHSVTLPAPGGYFHQSFSCIDGQAVLTLVGTGGVQ